YFDLWFNFYGADCSIWCIWRSNGWSTRNGCSSLPNRYGRNDFYGSVLCKNVGRVSFSWFCLFICRKRTRSEERRVGKECRSRGAGEQSNKTNRDDTEQ